MTQSAPLQVLPEESPARTGPRSIPSLDGLRAIAVSMVILAHWVGYSTLAEHGLMRTVLKVVGQGGLGVTTFFVISGFLITTLLLNEGDKTGTLNLRRFYFRRSLRIFPPYYVYLAVAWGVAHRQLHPIPAKAFWTAVAYVSNYYPYIFSHPDGTGWYVAHTWSLSVEEQFYLFWPLLLVLLPRRLAQRCGVAILLAAPFVRWLTVRLVPVYALDGQWYRLFHTDIDILMVGCMIAFLVRRPGFRSQVERFFHPALLLAACAYLTCSTLVYVHAPAWIEAIFGVSLTSLSIGLLLVYVVIRHDSFAGRILNCAPLRHLGMISYSLYLWQQLFLGPYRAPSSLRMVLAALVCAEVSYWIVERPILKLRSVVEKKVSFLHARSRSALQE